MIKKVLTILIVAFTLNACSHVCQCGKINKQDINENKDRGTDYGD